LIGKFSSYQKCQLGGWLLYGIITLLNGLLFTTQPYHFYAQVITRVVVGLIVTHVLRELIRRFRLRPPMPLYKLPVLMVMVFGMLVFYALINGAMIDWLHIYGPGLRFPVHKRFLANFILDSPIILVWVCFYYLWHYIQLGTAIDKKISDLEKTARQMKQELGFSEP
jgi:two-component system LytT family sensor kinase